MLFNSLKNIVSFQIWYLLLFFTWVVWIQSNMKGVSVWNWVSLAHLCSILKFTLWRARLLQGTNFQWSVYFSRKEPHNYFKHNIHHIPTYFYDKTINIILNFLWSEWNNLTSNIYFLQLWSFIKKNLMKFLVTISNFHKHVKFSLVSVIESFDSITGVPLYVILPSFLQFYLSVSNLLLSYVNIINLFFCRWVCTSRWKMITWCVLC